MKKNRHNKPGQRSFSDYLILTAKGLCMGASDVVPGVSGGTMALILGIYEELIGAINSFDIKCLQYLITLKIRLVLDKIPWRFLFSLCLGILLAILCLSKGLSWLLQNEPVFIWSFFLGLILASALSVGRRVEQWMPSTWLCLFGGISGAYLLIGLVPVSTPNAPWFLFLSGAIAICAMILPGISGSFILVLLGKYQFVLDAVNKRDFFVLFMVAAGACLGIVLFSHLLGRLLKKHHDLMIALLTGFMLGSLRKIWPWKETYEGLVEIDGHITPIYQSNILPVQWNTEVLIAFFLILTGILTVFLLDRMANRIK